MTFYLKLNFVDFVIFIFLLCFQTSSCSIHNETEHIEIVGWDSGQTKGYLFFTIFIFLVSFGKLCYHRFHFISSYFPESFLLILIGIASGVIIKYFSFQSKLTEFTPQLFFLILLPPIVLDSAYHMYNRTFGEILGIVIIFAVLGTVFSFLIIAFALYGLEVSGIMGELRPTNSNLMAILLFSSLIVAVDPVAVLAIFKDLGVDKELYYMIFGESLLNDAVTIVLYEIIKQFIVLGSTGINALNIFLGFISFFTVSFGGLLIGIIIGMLSSLVTRFQSSNEIHCIIIISSAYLAYILAYTLKWSGIISIIGCGIIQAAYGFKNITKDCQMTLKIATELMASASEAIIFVFLGLEVFLVDQIWNVGFQISSILLCIIARFLVILVLRFCINYVSVDQRKISWTELFVATYGGLRGAVAFSLVILIHPEILGNNGPISGSTVKSLFNTTTLVIIIFTVSVMGTTMKPLAKLLSVRSEKHELLSVYNELNANIIDNLLSGLEVLINQRGRNRFRIWISNFDNSYVRPWLVNDPYDNNTFKIIKRYEQISLALHYAGLNKDVADKHLSDIPKSLWPNETGKPQKENDENLQLTIIKLMRNRSKLVRQGEPTSLKERSPESPKIEFLESVFSNKLNDIIRRRSSVCNSSSRIKVQDKLSHKNQWQSLIMDRGDRPGHSQIVSPFLINVGFILEEKNEPKKFPKETQV